MTARRFGLCWTLLAFLAVLTFATSPAQAQATGRVNLGIDFPAVVILYFYSDLDVTVPSSALTAMVGSAENDEGTPPVINVTAVPAGLTGDFGMIETMVTPLGLDPANVQMTLQNTWAVRSIGDGSGDTQVAISLTGMETTLNGDNGGTITIGSASNSPTTFPPTGLGGFQLGDLVLGLNIGNVTQAGTYENTAGPQLTITATNL